tara:strand:+ start:399 stop:758 length:360 start_codon:yes stop_codon:yes gene_type:complete
MENNISYNNVWDKSGNLSELVLMFDVDYGVSSVALEMLDLSKKGFIKISRSLTQKNIETQISYAIDKLLSPPVTPGTGEFLKCGKCGKTGKENGVCVFGACLTFIPIKGGGKGSITWTF